MISEAEMFSVVCIKRAFSKPMDIIRPRFRSSMVIAVGMMPGISICMVRFNLLAPSTMAASWRSWLILVRAAI